MNIDYYEIPPQDLSRDAKIPLMLFDSSEAVFRRMAEEMADTIAKHNAEDKSTVFILPVGPVGQYPHFVSLVNGRGLSLNRCWFFNMDEYLTDEDAWISSSSPLSFRGFMDREVYGKIRPELLPPDQQRIFPDPADPERVDRLLVSLGGADICFGGIGITGHLAFNEPDPNLAPEEYALLPTRILNISPETRTANSIADLGGALERMPHRAVTLGMKSILAAKKVRLGVFRDWHRAVCRRAAFGDITSAFPVTLLQIHPDARIYVNDVAARLPW